VTRPAVRDQRQPAQVILHRGRAAVDRLRPDPLNQSTNNKAPAKARRRKGAIIADADTGPGGARRTAVPAAVLSNREAGPWL